MNNNVNCVSKSKSECFGCRACTNSCPTNAIKMKEDEEGFFYPVIDSKKCTDCGLCKKACPSLNKSEVYQSNTANPDCYALIANDEIRAVSSSGGAFTLIANEIFEKGGVVCGVAFVGQKVQHIIVEKKEDLVRLRGSKYVQSDTNTVYSQIKEILKTGKVVLFTGTPCQVAGLNIYLGKTYENLYTIDLICHGVPPQKIFDMYLKETIGDEAFINGTFRDKNAGWFSYGIKVQTDKNCYYKLKTRDSYLQAFIKNMSLRPSCANCPFTSSQRQADITIGDFWEIERYKPELNDNKGTSLVLLNNMKGKNLFNLIKNKVSILESVPIEYAKYHNITLYTPLKQYPNRQAFFRLLNQGRSLEEAVDYCNKYQYDVMLLNFWTFKNAGGVLQAWALQNMVSDLGYSNILINYQFNGYEKFVEDFARKYLHVTDPCFNYTELSKYNNLASTLIVGSDCVWGKWNEDFWFREIFMGSFTDSNTKKIAYAPSFGESKYIGSVQEKEKNKYWLQKFDRISLRESSGVNVLKKEFDVDGTLVLDPTLCLDAERYDELIKHSKYNKKGYILEYVIKKKSKTHESMDKKIKGKSIISFSQNELNDVSMEDWLYLIKNAKLFITSSYHGCCLAIKLNIPFWACPNSPKLGDTTRFDSLLGILGLKDRLLNNEEDVQQIKDVYEPIDWDRVNAIVEKEKERSIKWLKDALEAPKDLSKLSPSDAVIRSLNDKIAALEVCNSAKISIQDFSYALNYKKNYRKYLKYKILKNVVWGKTRKRYKRKQKELYQKIRAVRKYLKVS